MHNWRDLDGASQITRTTYPAADNTSTDQALTGPKFIVEIDISNAQGAFAGLSSKDGALLYKLAAGAGTAGLYADVFIVYGAVVVIKFPTEPHVEY